MPRIPQVWLVAGGGWIGRGIQILAQLVAVRILIEGLGASGYGAFAVLASLQGWFLLADLGIGISIQNYISERRAHAVPTGDVVLTGALLSLGVTCVAAGLVYLSGPSLGGFLLGKLGTLSRTEQTTAFYAIAFPGIGTALGSVVYKVWFAEHRGYLSQLVPAAGTVAGTLAVWAANKLDRSLQVSPAILLYYAPLAILPVLALALAIGRRASGQRFRPDLVRPILGRGVRFWIFGLLQAGVLQVDYIVMARVLDAGDIVIYSIAARLFSLILFLYSALLMALWPVFVESIARHEWAAILKMLQKYLLVGLLLSLAGGLFVDLFRQTLTSILAPSLRTPIPTVIIILLTINLVVRTWTDMFAMVLQCMNDLKVLWLIVPVQSVLSVTLQTWGARSFGLPGMIGGLIACFVLTVSWILPLRFFILSRRVAHSPG